jgi:hypothetical protein
MPAAPEFVTYVCESCAHFWDDRYDDGPEQCENCRTDSVHLWPFVDHDEAEEFSQSILDARNA